MNKKLLFFAVILSLSLSQFAQTQSKEIKKHDPNAFDEEAALLQAKAKGIKSTDIKGYVEALKNDFSSQKALKKQKHIHTPYETAVKGDVLETVIYIKPNQPMSIGCPNMGFEQYNFSGWTGGSGTVSTGPVGGNPIYTSAGTAIINSAGNNVSFVNTVNYHTIMTIPATNSIVPNHVAGGYDSIACRVAGSNTVSEIPVVSPFSFDPVSVRLNSGNANYKAARLKYITTTSSTNQQLTFSYALVLNDPSSHFAEESPYFKVEVRNETTNTILPGCTSYTFNPKTSLASDSLKTSIFQMNFDVVKYRKWQYYTVDLSTLPPGTNVSVNFEVGGCTQGGHAGYAYVDADCGGIGKPYANMCSGSSFATLVAPQGFINYQWQTMPGNTPIAGATNDTLIVPGANPNDVFAVQMVSPGGCTVTLTDTVKPTTVNIINLNANSSCAGGANGSAYVQANGSNGIYTYTWTNTGTGSIVANSQTATGLAPGNYSVVVASTTCGQASANISVGISPPFFLTQTKSYCGNFTFITPGSGTNHHWYGATAPSTVITQISTNDTLFVSTPVVGGIYTLVYNNAFGCKDSIQYTLTLAAGGNSYLSNFNNVCPGNTNGSVSLNISSILPTPYTYSVVGTGGTIVPNTSITSSVVSISALAAGSYTAASFDGLCFYQNTFTISPIQTNFTMTPTHSVVCYPNDTARIQFNFGSTTFCALSSAGDYCSTPNSIQLGAGTALNTTTGYPAIYGNYYRNTRHQILYTATELISAGIQKGKISSISFNINTINGITSYPDFTIKMKCTSTTNLSSLTFETALTQVYYATSVNISNGWNIYNFPVPYEWDGVSNLLIDVCNSQTPMTSTYPFGYSSNSQSPYTITPFVSVRYFSSDGTVACPIATASGSSSNRPNIKFENCGAVNPASYTIAVNNGSITTNFTNDSIKLIPPPTFIVPANNTPYVYSVTVTNPIGGCAKTQTVAILYPAAQTSITAIAATSATICEGSSINLSATGAVTYTWSYGTIGNVVGTTQSITVTPPVTGVNIYTVTGTAPCNALPDTKTVTVNVTPKANLVLAPLQDITKCLNKNYVFNASVSSATPGNSGTPYTYAWTTLPTNAPASGVNNAASYTVTSNSTTSLVVTVNGVCANADKDTVVIKDFVDNLSIAIVDTSTTCAGTELTLHSLVSGGRPAYSYNWFMDANTTPISNTSNLTMTSPQNSGTYTISVFVTDSCGYNRPAYEVITVLPPCSVIVPNVITPNGDGINDVFKIANLEHHPNTAVTIFDRWGRKVYENANYNNDWKADNTADGTFFYVVDVPDDKKYSGYITIFHSK